MPTAPVYHSFESGLNLCYSGTIPGQIGELIIPPTKLAFSNGDTSTIGSERRYRVMHSFDGSIYRIRIR